MGVIVDLTQGDLLDHCVKDSDGCWLWDGQRTKDGYGIVGREENGKVIYAHRAAYELWKGPIPKGFHVHHICEKAPCFNPKCLRAVTRSVNQKQYHTRRFGQMSRSDLRVCRFVHGLVTESAKLRMDHADL